MGRRGARRAASALPLWSFALTATDANRWALRLCRAITGRPVRARVQLLLPRLGRRDVRHARRRRRGRARARATSARRSTRRRPRASASSTTSTRCERLLADEQVACVLTEPALTNIGIVLPEPGFLDGLRAACDRDRHAADRRRDAHAQRRARAAARAAWGLRARPRDDRQGDRRRRADRRLRRERRRRRADRRRSRTPTSSTSAASAARWPATRCRSPPRARRSARCSPTRRSTRMIALCDRFVAGVRDVIAAHGVPWSIVQLGARAELAFAARAAADRRRERGAARRRARGLRCTSSCSTAACCITPFHNMALMSPATTAADVDRHTEVFAEALAALAHTAGPPGIASFRTTYGRRSDASASTPHPAGRSSSTTRALSPEDVGAIVSDYVEAPSHPPDGPREAGRAPRRPRCRRSPRAGHGVDAPTPIYEDVGRSASGPRRRRTPRRGPRDHTVCSARADRRADGPLRRCSRRRAARGVRRTSRQVSQTPSANSGRPIAVRAMPSATTAPAR